MFPWHLLVGKISVWFLPRNPLAYPEARPLEGAWLWCLRADLPWGALYGSSFTPCFPVAISWRHLSSAMQSWLGASGLRTEMNKALLLQTVGLGYFVPAMSRVTRTILMMEFKTERKEWNLRPTDSKIRNPDSTFKWSLNDIILNKTRRTVWVAFQQKSFIVFPLPTWKEICDHTATGVKR